MLCSVLFLNLKQLQQAQISERIMDFGGKVVLITGASSGIGAGAACHMAKLGAKVALVGRNEKRLSEVIEKIKKSHSPAPLPIVADVTVDAERIVSETVKHFGQLDVLINNAGFGIRDNIIEADLAEFDRLFNTNVRSVINLTKLCVPHLEQTKGNIVNISSVAGIRPVPNHMSYCVSKAALDQLTKCSALDLAAKGIRVNSVNPAAVRTQFFETLGLSAQQSDQLLDQFKDKYPVGRVGEVADISAAIAFLANDETASFLTGAIFPVDGGCLVTR